MKHNIILNRFFTLTIMMCFLFTSISFPVFAEEAESVLIPDDAIFLSTPEDILSLADSCISDAWSRGKVFVLENDMDLTGYDFASIPSFGGTFLGQGHTISGLWLTGEQNAQGFFRYLQKTAIVDSLHLKGIIRPAKRGNLDIGGLVGVNSGLIKNCSFTGTVSGTERIGGIAGRNKVSGIIENSSVSGSVYGDHYIGGIVGENLGVIRFCTNNAQVNTQVDHNSVSGVISGLTLENFTAKESISDATNIGGIAGTSSGVIRSCANRANIGYEKMGYNVGGIAGSQIGFITECKNYATVHGSNGVGGIVGQFKPNVVLNMGENYMSNLTDQMIGLMGSMSGMMYSMQGMMGGLTIDKESMEESMEMLKDPQSWDPDSIQAAVGEMSESFNTMYQDMIASGKKMTGQMQSMMGSMSGMVETMEKLNEGLNIKIVDISKEDTPDNNQTKVSLCENHGSIHGETHVGGIVGIADIEDTTAPKEIQGQLTMSTEGELIMRLVIRSCKNTGTVSANKKYAGGIVGNMVIGAIFQGMNTGSLDALNADYVGGIAGSSETYIVDSTSRSILAGNQYVGGIAGYGAEVSGCYSLTDIAAAQKFAGGILGYADPLPDEETGLIIGNRYYLTGDNLGGIDGICYEGATAPMTIAEFLALDTLDDMFRSVTLRFQIAGQEDIVMNIDLGTSLSVADIPQLEVGDKELYQWQLIPSVTDKVLAMGETADIQYISTERLRHILFDQTYKALFDVKNSVVASEELTDTGRPLALAVGAFDQGTTLNLTKISDLKSGIDGVNFTEGWQVSMPDIGIERLHFHMPAGLKTDRITLYIKDSSGNWMERNFTVEGSYLIFDFSQNDVCFALENLPEEAPNIKDYIIPVGAVILLLILIIFTRIQKKKKVKTAKQNPTIIEADQN